MNVTRLVKSAICNNQLLYLNLNKTGIIIIRYELIKKSEYSFFFFYIDNNLE